jgi:hypothetical protein
MIRNAISMTLEEICSVFGADYRLPVLYQIKEAGVYSFRTFEQMNGLWMETPIIAVWKKK